MYRKKKREQYTMMDENARELINYFSHKNLDAIVKLIKSTLEKLRKRITNSHTISYSNRTEPKDLPIFKCYIVLSIPNIHVQPSLDEIQQTLNRTVQMVVNISKDISIWNRPFVRKSKNLNKSSLFEQPSIENFDTLTNTDQQSQLNLDDSDFERRTDSERPVTPLQNQRSSYKYVNENKEVVKMISMLSTCITSNKKSILNALDKFKGKQFSKILIQQFKSRI